MRPTNQRMYTNKLITAHNKQYVHRIIKAFTETTKYMHKDRQGMHTTKHMPKTSKAYTPTNKQTTPRGHPSSL